MPPRAEPILPQQYAALPAAAITIRPGQRVTTTARRRFLWALLWAVQWPITCGDHPRLGQQWNRPRPTGHSRAADERTHRL